MSSIGQEGVPIETVPLLTLLLLEHGSYLPCYLYYAIIMPHTIPARIVTLLDISGHGDLKT